MNERPVSDAIDALSEIPEVAERETQAAADLVRDEAAQVAGIMRQAGQVPGLSGVADEIDALSERMRSALGELPDVVAGAVQAELDDLATLARPDDFGTASGGIPAAGLDLDSVAVFGPPAGEPDTDSAEPQARTMEFATEEQFNAAADVPQPNTTYRYRDVEWRTDELARTISVTGVPRLEPATRRPGMQANIGHRGRPTDVGFHLLGHALGGPTNPINVVAGNGQRIEDGLANLNQGAYKKFENQVRQYLKAGHDVHVQIDVVYDPSNATKRPDEFVARVWVDGERSRPYRFTNK